MANPDTGACSSIVCMYIADVYEPPKDGNIPDFNISKIDICLFGPIRVFFDSFKVIS